MPFPYQVSATETAMIQQFWNFWKFMLCFPYSKSFQQIFQDFINYSWNFSIKVENIQKTSECFECSKDRRNTLLKNVYVSWSERLQSSEKREERPLIMFRTLISTQKVVKEQVFFWVLRSKTKKNTSFFTTFPVEIYVRDTLSVDAFPFWVDFEFWPRIVF
jgi:hypothetical protein